MPKKILPYLLYCCCFYLSACSAAGTKRVFEELVILDGNRELVIYNVEIADNNVSRKKGLMFREELPVDRGMLLDYGRATKMGIWMKNTYVPLDIIFINTSGVIVKIHENAEPLSTKTIKSGKAVRAVLEVNAGQVREHGIKTGHHVRHGSFKRK